VNSRALPDLQAIIRKVLFLLYAGAVLFSCHEPENTGEQLEASEEIKIPEPQLLFGLPIDSLQIESGKIKWNQTLGALLKDYIFQSEKLFEVARLSRDVYDVRKIKAGSPYTIIYAADSLKELRQVVVEPDLKSFVIYNFHDSAYVEKVDRPVKTIEKQITGVINTSVYHTILEAGAPHALVHKMVDILAWQVDFDRMQKGDRFKVIYEEEQVEGSYVGLGKVLGVYFEHFGESYYGVRHEYDNGKVDYFDEEGNSLRKAFLKSPLDYKRISSRFSLRRYHPVQKRYKAHLGTDYAANPGTPIRSVGDGVVLEAKYHQFNGNYVKIRHNSNYTTQYLHMQKIKTGIRPGVTVKQGQTIGFVGSTGLANGPHLCFRFWKNGRQVDALNVDLPPSEPIAAAELDSYLHQKNVIMHRLDLMDFDRSKIMLARMGSQP
jgi:murein DD-endopeptidase MepM/ murein hydrolase activator NlpD